MTRVFCLAALAFVVVLGLWAGPVAGQVETPAGATAVELRYFDFFVVKGGWIAYLIILLSVVMVALAIEYCFSIRRATVVPPQSALDTKELLDARKYVEAIEYTGEDPSMLGYALNSALLEAANGFSAMERALEEAIDERAARLFRKIEALNVIGNVAPMLGLFGTVVGMIMLFAEIHASAAFPPAQTVANAVAVALITTFWGLAVAIPALSIHAIFRNRIEVLTAECALTAERLLAVFKPAGTIPVPAPVPSAKDAKDVHWKTQHAVRA